MDVDEVGVVTSKFNMSVNVLDKQIVQKVNKNTNKYNTCTTTFVPCVALKHTYPTKTK